MRLVRLIAPAALTAIVVTAGCSPVQSALGAAGNAASTKTKASAVEHLTATWNKPTASLQLAARTLTGTVAPKQRVRVVRLTTSAGHPVLSVTTAVGQTAAETAVRIAQQAPGSVSVSVDSRSTAAADPVSNDTYRGDQWALTTLSAESTWKYSRGVGVTVAVIDTGVSLHPDLAGQLLSGVDYVLGVGDGTDDENGHGTHVAGIIAALANNNMGVAGIAPGVKIMPIRALDASGSGWTSDIAKGLIYAADHGARVINLSLGGPAKDSVLASAVAYAESKNVLVVAAAGNDGPGGPTSYPGAYPGVLAVAASDSTNAIASFSTRGSYVKITAPGVGILSTYPSGYAFMSGTSMATPYVAGVAALVRAAAPTLTASAVATDLTATAIDLGPAGQDAASGAGLVSPTAAVCRVSTCAVTPLAPIVSTRIDLQAPPASITYGQAAALRARLVNAATGLGVAGQRVQWCYGPAGSAATCVATTTDANGWSSYRFAPLAGGRLEVDYAGGTRIRASVSAKYTVAVPPEITQRAGRATLAVTLRPAVRATYTLQRWTGKSWVTIGSGSTDTAGRVTFSKLSAREIVHVVIGATGGRATATSPPISIL